MTRVKKYYAEGLCRCGKPPVPGRKHCRKCLDYDKKYKAKTVARNLPAKRLFKLCHEPHCHAEAVPGFSACDYHLDQRNSAQRALTAARIKAGVCSKCGAPPAPGKKKCQEHLDLAARNQATYKRKKKAEKARRAA